MKIMATSFERSHACTPVLSAPDPTAGHRWPMPPPETPGHSQASLGQSLVRSLLLSPGSWYTQGFICALQESCVSSGELPQSCVSYGGSVSNPLQEGLCHTQACWTQSPCPWSRPLLTCSSTGDTQILKGRSGSVSVGSPGLHNILFEPSEHLWLA